ncbi:MAG: tRNA (adenosine(37)-N6)-dimethylallyltransferase MiaA [Planctomycetota bacterium]|nr:tRNA (adenosine(37)-N6)-dimethylallyltransferase MiaA [Planctomycetota bacterium]
MNSESQMLADWIVPPLDNVLYLTGPTGSGKTQVAVELAESLQAEIVSVDSMAVYKGMDIGTAKPSIEARKKIPHHLIDIVDPTHDYSVSEFLKESHSKVGEIQGRGKNVLLVGGTPLYLKSLICGFFHGPPADWDFRKAVEDEVQTVGIQALAQRLKQVDPLSAHRILPGDQRRMIRALEVSKLTGKPLSHWQTQFERFVVPAKSHAFVLGWERSVLHHRVALRVEKMLSEGLVDEVAQLKTRYGTLGRTASQAVGYKEPIAYLSGSIGWDSMKEKIIVHTRQFVRRQEIWFRSMPGMRRLELTHPAELDTVSLKILSALENRQIA